MGENTLIRQRWTRLLIVASLGIGCSNGPTDPLSCTEVVDGVCWTYLGLQGPWIYSVIEAPEGLFAATDNGLFRFSGSEWTRLTLDNPVASLLRVPNPPRLIAGVYTNSSDTTAAAAFSSTDGGSTWFPADGGRSARNDYRASAWSLALDARDSVTILMGDICGVLRSATGGQSWNVVWGSPGMCGNTVRNIATSKDGSGLIVVGGANSLFRAYVIRSMDGGNSWEEVFPNPQDEEGIYQENEILGLAIDPRDSRRVLAGMQFGYIIRSEDHARTWRRVFQTPATNPGFVWSIRYIGADVYAVAAENFRVSGSAPATDLGFYRSRDSGATWAIIRVPAAAMGGTTLAHGLNGSILIGTQRGGVWRVNANSD